MQVTPDEVMDKAYQRSRDALADELLDRVKSASPGSAGATYQLKRIDSDFFAED